MIAVAAVLCLLAGSGWFLRTLSKTETKTETKAGTTYPANVTSLESLMSLPEEQLAAVDIARMNLLCAEGLPGAEEMALNLTLARIDQMA